MFAIPAVLIVCHEYLNAFFAIAFFIANFVLFAYYTYQEFLPEIQRAQLEDEAIIAGFDGDPEKIRFYRAFKKHFDGDLNLDELKQWLIDHPRKY